MRDPTTMRRWALGMAVAFVVLAHSGAAYASEVDKLAQRPDVQKQLLHSCLFTLWQESLQQAGYTLRLEEGVVASRRDSMTMLTQVSVSLYRQKQFIGVLHYLYDQSGAERAYTQEYTLLGDDTLLVRTRDGAELGFDLVVNARGESHSELAFGDGLVRLSDFAPADIDWECFRNCYWSNWIARCAWDCVLCVICGWWACPWTCPNCGHCSLLVGIECAAACWR